MKTKQILFFVTALIAVLVFAGCPATDEPTEKDLEEINFRDGNELINGGGERPSASNWPNPVQQSSIDPNNPSTKTLKRTAPTTAGVERQRIVHEVWVGIDTNADPRNVLGYKLVNSDKQFFDNVVIFHAGLTWDHWDSAYPDGQPPINRRHWCPKTGIHLHLHDRTQWILADWNKFIKPLKDAGLRVLICPLPSSGISYHTIGDWPGGNNIWNNRADSGGVWGNWQDICGVPGAKKWAKELADFCAEYNFDGIALDDEYGESPKGTGGLRSEIYSANATASGQNIFRWLRYFKDITTDEQYPTGKWVSVYYHRNGQNIPGSLAVASVDKNGNDIPSQTYSVNTVVDALFPAQYGVSTTSMTPSALETSRRGYVSNAFDGSGSSISVSPDTIGATTYTLMNGGYGIMMYFALRERQHYKTMKFFGPMGSMPESWLSLISNVLYRDGVWYEGPDHPKFPMQRGVNIWTNNTGALYKNSSVFGENPKDFASEYY